MKFPAIHRVPRPAVAARISRRASPPDADPAAVAATVDPGWARTDRAAPGRTAGRRWAAWEPYDRRDPAPLPRRSRVRTDRAGRRPGRHRGTPTPDRPGNRRAHRAPPAPGHPQGSLAEDRTGRARPAGVSGSARRRAATARSWAGRRPADPGRPAASDGAGREVLRGRHA